MNKKMYSLYLIINLLTPYISTFSQDISNIPSDSYLEEDQEHRDSRHQHHRSHRKRENSQDRRLDNDQPPKSGGFTFWFSSKNSKPRHMKVFDTHAIFDFDREIEVALQNTKKLQHDFRKEIRLLDVQISYLEKELQELIIQHRAGNDKTDQLVETYIKLYQLCDQRYSAINTHTKEIQDILAVTYKNYKTKMNHKMDMTSTNSDVIITELLDRYTSFER